LRRRGAPLAVAAAALTALTLHPSLGFTDPGPANQCPPFSFVNNKNLVKNPSFENVGPNGSPTTWHNGDPVPPPSAAAHWTMHSSNSGATVRSELVPTNVPGNGGAKMLHFVAGGNEGGVFQQVPDAPAKLMFSAWVFVKSGHVAMQPNAGTTGPAAWSERTGEWEQLRVCTDGSVPTGFFAVVNEDPTGGNFFVDRVEVRQIP